MMNGAREQAFQRINQFRQPGSAPGQFQGAGSADDDDYDHYNVEGSDPQLRKNQGWNQGRRGRGRDFDFDSGDNVIDDLGGAVLGAALGFAGRAIGRRMKKAFEEKVIPAMEAKAAQFEQSKAEQDAIVARYPELRGCTKDQVVFVDGGMRTVPISEIKMPVTLAQADSIVARLR
jgi:hypothetical protein